VCRWYFHISGPCWGRVWHSRMNPYCVQKPASLTELASLAYAFCAEIWSFESVDSTDIKSVFVCDVCDRFFLMFWCLYRFPCRFLWTFLVMYLVSFPHSLRRCTIFLFGWSGRPLVWTSYIFILYLWAFCVIIIVIKNF
jgi:hypothetical protein